MKLLDGNFCESCYSCCSKQGAFTLWRYRKGGEIVFPNCKNYMIFVLSGSLHIRSDEVLFDCPGGQIILLIENVDYSITVTEDCEILALGFIRSFQVCEKMGIEDARDILRDYRYTYHSMPIKEPMECLIKSIVMYINDGIDCVSMHNAKQLEMFIVCRFYYSERELLEFFIPTLDKGMFFQSLVRANYSKAKNVEELADMCGYTLHSFKKTFKSHFHISPYQWMLQQNKGKILALLMATDIPIKAIVAEFGFTCQSHLNRYCKRYLGGTSAQIRNGRE